MMVKANLAVKRLKPTQPQSDGVAEAAMVALGVGGVGAAMAVTRVTELFVPVA